MMVVIKKQSRARRVLWGKHTTEAERCADYRRPLTLF